MGSFIRANKESLELEDLLASVVARDLLDDLAIDDDAIEMSIGGISVRLPPEKAKVFLRGMIRAFDGATMAAPEKRRYARTRHFQ